MSDHVNSIIKGIKILELFSVSRPLLGITDIKDLLGFPIGTIHRIVSTLEYYGYLQQDTMTTKYRLGLKAYILGTNVDYIKELKRTSRPFIKELSEKFREVVHLAILYNDHVLCIDKNDSMRNLSATPKEGELNHAYLTSVGKCLLAHKSLEYQNGYLDRVTLEKHTDNTITTREGFLEELKKVKQLGYAIDDEESEIGLTCFGAPIFGSDGECIAAISISMPTVRIEDKKAYCDGVSEAASAISARLH